VNDIKNVRMSDAKIDKTTNEVVVASEILKRNTIYGTKMSVELYRSAHRVVISKARMIKKIMNVLSVGEMVATRCGCDLNLKKVAKRTQVGHVKLLTETTLNKENILIVIPHDDHIIYI
jgi:hypothetical protein